MQVAQTPRGFGSVFSGRSVPSLLRPTVETRFARAPFHFAGVYRLTPITITHGYRKDKKKIGKPILKLTNERKK